MFVSIPFLILIQTLINAWLSSAITVYAKVGETAVLSPGPVTKPITSITWKHGSDLAVEWFENTLEPYRQFKVRGFLNSSTSALTITGLIQSDSGNYTLEINGKVTDVMQLLVISPVPTPTISMLCNQVKTLCVFTCEGSTTGAEPVTYQWISGNINVSSTNEFNITEEFKELWFRCVLHNPISNKRSDLFLNPFINLDRHRSGLWISLSGFIVVVLCIGVAIYRKDREMLPTPVPCGQETANREQLEDQAAETQDED